MPDALVEVRGSWIGDRKPDFLDAIDAAILESLKTPPGDTILRLIEHAPNRFVHPRGAGDKFTRIEIMMFPGRSGEAKRALYKAIVRNLARFDVPAQDVKILLVEVPKENVGLRGGNAASDLDLGYETTV